MDFMDNMGGDHTDRNVLCGEEIRNMDNKIKAFIENEIRSRLRKYDVVSGSDCNDESLLCFMKDNAAVSKELLYKFLNDELCDYGKNAFELLQATTGVNTDKLLLDQTVPEKIRDAYTMLIENCQIFLDEDNPWLIYRKDILRGIAFHEWINKLTYSGIDLTEGYMKNGSMDEFINLPISIGLCIDEHWYTAYIKELGGGILNSEIISKSRYLNIFKNEKMSDEDIAGIAPSKIKEKGVPYRNYRDLLTKITEKELSAADIWFLKNTLAPELVVSIGDMLRDRSIGEDDRKLIKIICKCLPPSIRFYLFEAIKPLYKYIEETLVKKLNRDERDRYVNIVFEKLSRIIDEVNRIYLCVTEKVNTLLDHYKISADDFILLDSTVNSAFSTGDDFHMLPPTVEYENETGFYGIDKKWVNLEVENDSSKVKRKKYIDFLPETNDGSDNTLSKVVFYVISALNAERESNLISRHNDGYNALEKDDKDKQQVMKLMLSFKNRLYRTIM